MTNIDRLAYYDVLRQSLYLVLFWEGVLHLYHLLSRILQDSWVFPMFVQFWTNHGARSGASKHCAHAGRCSQLQWSEHWDDHKSQDTQPRVTWLLEVDVTIHGMRGAYWCMLPYFYHSYGAEERGSIGIAGTCWTSRLAANWLDAEEKTLWCNDNQWYI